MYGFLELDNVVVADPRRIRLGAGMRMIVALLSDRCRRRVGVGLLCGRATDVHRVTGGWTLLGMLLLLLVVVLLSFRFRSAADLDSSTRHEARTDDAIGRLSVGTSTSSSHAAAPAVHITRGRLKQRVRRVAAGRGATVSHHGRVVVVVHSAHSGRVHVETPVAARRSTTLPAQLLLLLNHRCTNFIKTIVKNVRNV